MLISLFKTNITALQVVECKGNTFEVNEDALASILKKPLVQDCKVMVVSVIGGIGSGNSFLLNVFLKYLKNRGKPVSFMFVCIFVS